MTNLYRKAAAAALALGAAPAFAVGPSAGDLSGLTPDMSTVLTAIAAVAVVLIGVKLAIKAYHIVAGLMGSR